MRKNMSEDVTINNLKVVFVSKKHFIFPLTFVSDCNNEAGCLNSTMIEK